jgi:hypothetical protein
VRSGLPYQIVPNGTEWCQELTRHYPKGVCKCSSPRCALLPVTNSLVCDPKCTSVVSCRYTASCLTSSSWPTQVLTFEVLAGMLQEILKSSFKLWEPCVLYIGQAHRYPPNTPFYIFFQQIYVLNFLNMLHTPFFFSSKCRLFHNATFFWFLYYSHFKYRVC